MRRVRTLYLRLRWLWAYCGRGSGRRGVSRGTPRRPSGDALDHERKIIVSFDSTFDVMECEQLCLAAGVPGRIMPLPGSITAGCGLCWVMPFSGDALAAFRAATEGRITPADYHQLVL